LGISDPRASIAAFAVYVATKHPCHIIERISFRVSIENTNRDDFFSNTVCWYKTNLE
jgi:hypothetical protein